MNLLASLINKKAEEIFPVAKYRDANEVINYTNRNKVRSLEVEMRYSEVRYRFSQNMKNRKLHRNRILAIKKYLEENVNQYYPRNFKNDAHAIYTMLKAKDITLKDLEKVNSYLI